MSVGTGIRERAILVKLSVSTWSGRILDKEVTAAIQREHSASKESGEFRKNLLAGVDEGLKAVTSEAGIARLVHYHHTLAWNDKGWRLLPTENYMEYMDAMRKHRSAFEAKLRSFLASYDGLRQAARVTLGGLYREADYPTLGQLEARFGFDVQQDVIPDTSDLRVKLAPDVLAALEQEIAQRTSEAVAVAVNSAWQRLYQTVEHVRERLSDPGNIFRDSLIGNVRDVVDVLGRLNVTGDENLERARAAVEEALAGLDPQTLRTDMDVRSDAARKAAELVSHMGQFFSPGGEA